MWAILTDPAKADRRWDADEFFATGEAEIQTALEYLRTRGLSPDPAGTVLDFGCGIGRLTQALARRFDRVVGVDISESMLEGAESFNEFPDRCSYVHNAAGSLPEFADGSFGFVYSSIVLQHMEPQLARRYLAEFARILAPGGILVVQIPDADARRLQRLRARLALGSRLRRTSAAFGRSDRASQGAVIEMHHIGERTVRRMLGDNGMCVRDVVVTNATSPAFNGALVYGGRPRAGLVSKQYCAAKPVA